MRIVTVRVKPHARTGTLEIRNDSSLIARLAAPPVDGKANAALVELLAEHFGVPRSKVRIKSGASARVKLIEIGSWISVASHSRFVRAVSP
jgi:uncharacterized protein (TIGR00251 family)